MRDLFLIINILFTIGLSPQAQVNREIELGFSNSIFLKNRFAGTTETYESRGEYSSVNLKCTNSSAINVNFENSIQKTNWFYTASFEKRWLKYQGTVYQLNYNPETEKNKKESVNLINEMNNFKIGGGYNANLFNEKFQVRIYTNIIYRTYIDNEVVFIKNLNFHNLNVGDLAYNVKLNNSEYRKSISPELGIKVLARVSDYFKLFINFSYSSPIQTYYLYSQTEVISKTVYPTYSWTEVATWNKNDYRIKSNYLNFCIGLNYSVPRLKSIK